MLFTRSKPVHNSILFLFSGIRNTHLQQETICLSLWQGICSLLFNGILGCKHEEWEIQLECLVSHSNLFLLHGLKQCRLRLWSCPVDLISKHNVGEERAFLELEFLFPLCLINDVCSCNVR